MSTFDDVPYLFALYRPVKSFSAFELKRPDRFISFPKLVKDDTYLLESNVFKPLELGTRLNIKEPRLNGFITDSLNVDDEAGDFKSFSSGLDNFEFSLFPLRKIFGLVPILFDVCACGTVSSSVNVIWK